MRKLTAVIATLVTALAVLVFGLETSATAHVTAPANNAILQVRPAFHDAIVGAWDDCVGAERG